MPLKPAIVISGVTLVVGIIFRESPLWIPASVLAAGIIDLLTRRWYSSNAVGEWVAVSITLKFLFALIGFCATVGQLACLGLMIWWLLT